jgi:sulfatase maturation enzyme AslB (radical SAM superfamily)
MAIFVDQNTKVIVQGPHGAEIGQIVQQNVMGKIRFSLEGLGTLNDNLRGEKGGYEKKTAGLRRLKEFGDRKSVV